MPLIYVDPSIAAPDSPVSITLQANLSGISSSGVMAELRRYGIQDFDLNSPEILRAIGTNENGIKTFRTGAGSLGTGQFVLGTKFPNTSDIATQPMEVSRLGYLIHLLDDLLCAFKSIPRFEEPGRIAENGKSVRWGWGNWHLDPEPVLLRNSTEWLDLDFSSGNLYYIDYAKGIAYVQTPLNKGEDIRATYAMRLVPLANYRSFFTIALSILNGRKPQSSYTEDTFPDQWAGLLVYGAYELAAKCLLGKIQMFQYRRLFEDPDRLTAELRTNASEAKATFESMIPQIKRRGLVQPMGLTEYNFQQPYQVDETNFRQYAISR